jgi:hypothetical protein
MSMVENFAAVEIVFASLPQMMHSHRSDLSRMLARFYKAQLPMLLTLQVDKYKLNWARSKLIGKILPLQIFLCMTFYQSCQSERLDF